VNVTTVNQDVIGQYDVIIIAVKPYQVMEVMQDIHQTFRTAGCHTPKSLRPLVVSVAASVPLQEIEKKVKRREGKGKERENGERGRGREGERVSGRDREGIGGRERKERGREGRGRGSMI
jgi:hypothetical protein